MKYKTKDFLYGHNKKFIISSVCAKGKRGEAKKEWIAPTTGDFHKAMAIFFSGKEVEETVEKAETPLEAPPVTSPESAEFDWDNAPIEDVPNVDLDELLGYKKKDE